MSRQNDIATRSISKKKLLFWIILPIFMWGLSTLWQRGYQKTQATLFKTKLVLNQLHAQTPWLKELNTLYQLQENLRHSTSIYYTWVGLPQTSLLSHKIQALYHLILQAQLKPYLSQALDTQLSIDQHQNAFDLYQTLATYLMLRQPEHLQIRFVTRWFMQLWDKRYPLPLEQQQQLQLHLNILLRARPFIPWPMDTVIVQHARKILAQKPLKEIAFMMLQDSSKAKKIPLLGNFSAENTHLDFSHALVTDFFSATRFKNIYLTKIPALVSQLSQGNWVTGNNVAPNLSDKQKISLIQALREKYLEHCIQTWKKSLAQIKLLPPATFSEWLQTSKQLRTPNSPLWERFRIAFHNASLSPNNTSKNNTSPSKNNTSPAINTQPTWPGARVQNNFSALSHLLLHDSAAYKNLQSVLGNLSQTMKTLQNNPFSDVASYHYAVDRLQGNGVLDTIQAVRQLALHSPAPIQQWLIALADSSWKIILSHAKIYLEQRWNQAVLPFYQSNIEGRFPLVLGIPQEITSENFTRFFGPSGIIDTFFNRNLKPFVNMQNPYWIWKKQDEQTIDIPQSFLDMMTRASLIQRMFFVDNPARPSLQFQLAPIYLDPDIKKLSIDIDNHIFSLTPGSENTQTFIWPAPNRRQNIVILKVESDDQPVIRDAYSGPWAWLRLLSHAKIKTTNDPKQSRVTFQLKQHKVTLQLIADNAANPYLPNLLTAFRCPRVM